MTNVPIFLQKTFPENEIKNMIFNKLNYRAEFLKSRIDEVDRCKIQVLLLIDGFKLFSKNGLNESDLIYKRNALTYQVYIFNNNNYYYYNYLQKL
jgi:hypothetical protein